MQNKIELLSIYIGGIIGTILELFIFMFIYGWATGLVVNWTLVFIIGLVWALIVSPILFFIKYTDSKRVLR